MIGRIGIGALLVFAAVSGAITGAALVLLMLA
jgi:hypothetical protein